MKMGRKFMIKYDVIIIGAGLGGLTAAATLSKKGMSVLLLEQYYRIGGFGQSYSIDGYTFDTAVHAIWFWEEISQILEELEIELDVVPARRRDRILFKDGYEFFATSIPEMKEQISKLVPHEAESIASYYDELLDAQKTMVNITNNPKDWNCRAAFAKYRELWKMTLEEVVNNKIKDPMARSLVFGYHDSYLCNYGWHYPAYHLYCTKYLYDGFLPVGGSQPLVDALGEAIIKYGGEIRTNAMVKKINVENGKARSVILDSGEEFFANRAIISNADAILTLDKMIGREHLTANMKEELDKWKRQVPSLSYYILNLGLDTDVKKEYGMQGDLTIYYPKLDILKGFKEINEGNLPEDFWLWMVFPSVNDPSLAPKGHSVATLSILVPYNCENHSHVTKNYSFDGFSPNMSKGEEYERFKEELSEKMLQRADEVYPQISSHVTVKDFITPQAIECITLNYQGSTLGVMAQPERNGSAPQKAFDLSIGFKMKTEIEGLYLAGGWTETGFSAPGVIGSGRLVSQEILGEKVKSIFINPEHRMERLS